MLFRSGTGLPQYKKLKIGLPFGVEEVVAPEAPAAEVTTA